MSSAILVCALAALSAGEASPRSAVALNVGVASAVGEVGVTYAFRVLTVLELELGVGWGYSGAQASFMPKLTFGTVAHRVVTRQPSAGRSMFRSCAGSINVRCPAVRGGGCPPPPHPA